VLAFCASSRKDFAERLGVPSALQGFFDAIIVSHVEIADSRAFAEAVLAADVIRWE